MKKYKTKNFMESIKYAFIGMFKMLKERNIRIYFVITIIFTILNILNKSNKIEWVIFIILCFSVYVAETINTSIEIIVDKLEPNKNIHAKDAKDLGAASVLFCGFAFFICEGIILLW